MENFSAANFPSGANRVANERKFKAASGLRTRVLAWAGRNGSIGEHSCSYNFFRASERPNWFVRLRTAIWQTRMFVSISAARPRQTHFGSAEWVRTVAP